MNALLRHKSGNFRPYYLMQGFKLYLRPNYCTLSNLKYNYNTDRAFLMPNKNINSLVTSSIVLTDLHVERDDYTLSIPIYNGYSYRKLHTSSMLYECTSKVESTVQKLKDQQKEKVEEIMKEASSASSKSNLKKDGSKLQSTSTSKVPTTESNKAVAVPKKPLQTRIWEELVHYYHGFRLLFIDVKISSKLLWRVLNGKTLTRRENKLLLRTTSDLFRLIPFSVFIVVPFMELLLPIFIKLFPGMLPSTFQTAKEREDKLRQSLQVRLEMAKFLQKTLDEMPVQHRDHDSEEAQQFEEFFKKIKTPSAYVSNEEIIKFAKRFDDEITLDSLSREQLAALCRVLELNTIGTTALLRFQLRVKLRSLVTDDRVIAREGVDSLDLFELQQACKSRGMRAYGLTAERLRFQLKEWIDLSLNEKVPPTLLLLSRAMLISDDTITTAKLKETIRVLPDAVAAHTKHAISESEGKVDNKTKIAIIKEEERKIKEEREEEREEIKAKRVENLKENMETTPKDDLKDTHILRDVRESYAAQYADSSNDGKKETPADSTGSEISSSDMRLLSEALKTLSSDKQLVVEKETIKELKEELADYKEDVEELREVRNVVKEPVQESRAAKMLYNRVNKMISHLDKVLTDLEQRQEEIKKTDAVEYYSNQRKDYVHIDELVMAMKRMKESSDEMRFKIVEDLLMKSDNDKDGAIKVNEIMNIVNRIDSRQYEIDPRQLEEFTALLTKQAQKRQQEEIVRIDDLMHNIKQLKETSDEARLKHIENVLDKFDSDKDGVITVNEILKVLESIGRENIKLNEKQIEELIALLGKEQIFKAEQKIEQAIAKSMKEAEKLKAEVAKSDPEITKMVDEISNSAKQIKDIARDLREFQEGKDFKLSDKLVDKAKCSRDEAEMVDPAKVLKDNAKELDGETPIPKPPTKPTNSNNVGGGTPPPSASASSTSTSTSTSASSSTAPSSTLSGTTAINGGVLREAAARQFEKIIPINSEVGLPQTEVPLPTSTATPTTSQKNTSSAATATASSISANAKKLI